MSDSINSYNISDKIRQIQGKISTSNTINGFIDTKSITSFLNQKNSDDPNILKILSGILVSLVGSQEKLKTMLVDLMAHNLQPLETKIKSNIKKYTFQLISCGVDGKLNVPLGVMDQPIPLPSIPQEKYPYIDQYDFYGLFTKNINDPVQNLQFDRNLNTFIKTNIDSQTPTFTWKNSDGVDVAKFTYYEPEEKILIGPPAGVDWGPSGIGAKEFSDLYLDSINLFPTESVLKDLMDSIFNMKEGTPYDVDLDFLNKLLTSHCNCKKSQPEDDRSKSTFDLKYDDFIPEKINENDPTLTTGIKFGPVDAPYPSSIVPKQPELNESYLKSVTVLTKNEFIMGDRNKREKSISDAISTIAQSQNNQTNTINLPLNTKFSLSPNVEIDMNLKMILMLPVILVEPLFSPKISMYFGVIYKRYYNNNQDLWKTKDDYYLFIGKLIELVIKDLIKFLLKKLFAIVKKEIVKLIKKIIVRILSEKIMGYVSQLQSLLAIYNALKGQIPPQIPSVNFDNCKSVLDNLIKLFETPNIPPGTMLPPGMSMMGMMKTGLSSTSITQSAVEKMNAKGLNTKAMPDGTPNPNVVIANSVSSAMVEGIQGTARIQVSTVGMGYGEGGGTIT